MLRRLPPITDANVLVGTNTADDAGVYRLSDDLAIVQTVDFFTPIVDDPYSFGAISAANSLSDIYAMGGRPITALNLVAFPTQRLPLDLLSDILRGGSDKAREAGVTIIGGHSIDDPEPKYGLAVTGLIHPARIVTNAGAQTGDVLILTKPLGIGIITTGIKRERVDEPTIARVTDLMTRLNRAASEAMLAVGVHACTDVTGYGLLGHLREMVLGSGVGARVFASRVPVLPETWPLVADQVVPGGTLATQRFLEESESVAWADAVSHEARTVLCDAQTSGGLLIAVPEAKADRLLEELRRAGVSDAAAIGSITQPGQPVIMVEEKG